MKLLYFTGLALKNIKSSKRKIIVVMIGFMFALSLLTSISVWSSTSEKIILKNFVNSTDYLFYGSSFLPGTTLNVINYLNHDNLTARADISINTYALFNVKNKSDNYRFYPLDNQQNNSDPIIETSAILTSLKAQDRLNKIFNINGTFPTTSHQFIVSQKVFQTLRKMYPSLTIGSHLNVSIGRRIPFVDNGENQLGAFEKVDYSNFTLVGIFKYNQAPSIIIHAYGTETINQAIIFPVEALTQADLKLIDNNGLRPNGMVVFNQNAVQSFGINGLIQLMNELNDRLKSRYWTAVSVVLYSDVVTLQQEYNFSFNSVYYYYPLIFLSLLLSNLASIMLVNDREEYINTLKAKGATSNDISTIFVIEFILISVFAIILGLPFSLLLSTLIPSIQSNGMININITHLFINNLVINPNDILNNIFLVLAVFFFSIILRIQYVIYKNELLQIKKQKLGIFNLELIKFIITIIVLTRIILLINNLNFSTDVQNLQTYAQNIHNLYSLILFFNILWLIISDYLTKVIFFIINKSVRIFYFIVPSFYFILLKNFKNKQNQTRILSFYFLFLLSIISFSVILETTYSNYQTNSAKFLQGADLRIQTQDTYDNFSSVISQINGIEMVSPVYSTYARIVNTEITVYAIEPSKFLDVMYWKNAEAIGPFNQVINSLNTNPKNGIVISQDIAKHLGYKTGQNIFISALEHHYSSNFTIKGFVISSPGLGIAASPNPEVNQFYLGWALVPLTYLKSNFNITNTNLFFAKIKDGYNKASIINQLKTLKEVISVNPNPINNNYIFNTILPYLPTTNAILLFTIFISIIFFIVLITLITESILKEREKENGILISIGIDKRSLSKIILIEFLTIILFTSIIAIIQGYILSIYALKIFVPLTLKRIFIPIKIKFDFFSILGIWLILFIINLIIILIKLRTLITKTSFHEVIWG